MEKGSKCNSRSSQRVKIVLVFIRKHCGGELPVKEITTSAFIGGRA